MTLTASVRALWAPLAGAFLLLAAHPAPRPAWAQSAVDGPTGIAYPVDPATKVAHAVRYTGPAPRMDGRLSDAVWSQARFFDDFVQKMPTEGAAPTERTEIGIVYDDRALYVGMRMYSNDPAAIQRNVSRRDVGVSTSEHVWVSFDSYRDRRTAYSFGVTASGVRMDFYHPRDHEHDLVMSFDPVWEAAAVVDSLGWTAELRIPFSQLRFSRDSVQVWGFNVDRWIPSRNEDLFWVPVPSNITAWSSRMGTLVGIEGIRPSRRLEILPYVAANALVASDPDPANPFDPDGRTAEPRIGADVKMGLGPNLTLDATVNPDFGQVDADPAVVNLSQFEVFFDERRPFFTEGARLLQGSGPSYFYSRRIGAPPPGGAAGDYVDRPDATTILGAAKLTGRMASGTSVGGLAAVTAREYADVFVADSTLPGGGTRATTEINTPTAFGVLRLQQEFGRDRSVVGAMLTGVQRDLDGSSLANLLSRRAVSGGLDWNLRFGRGWYSVYGWAGFSRVEGDTAVINAQQRSPRRYFQRPDQDYVRLDPTRTSLTGFAGGLGVGKISGRHWLWDVFYSTESPELETNDAGRITTADGHTGFVTLRYRETIPGKTFRSYELVAQTGGEWNYGRDRQFYTYRADAYLTFLSNIRLNLTAWQDQPSQDARLTRGGPSMGTSRYTVGIAQLASNFAASTQWNARVYYGRSDLGDDVMRLSGGLTLRPGPRWLLSATPNYLLQVNPRQYVQTRPDTLAAATYGARYIFATVDQTQWGVQFRFNYAFKPDLTLEVYAEPFVASGAYSRHGELDRPRSSTLRIYGEAPGTSASRDSTGAVTVGADGTSFVIANRDFNTTSFRSNVVLRWEWRPGSTLFLVWQQNRGAATPDGTRVPVNDLFRGLSAPGDNFFAVKVTYWFSAS